MDSHLLSYEPDTRPAISFVGSHIPRPVGGHPAMTGGTFATFDDLAHGRACGIPIAGGEEAGGVWLISPDQHTAVSGRTGSGKTFSCALSAIVLEARRAFGEKRNLMIVDAKSGIYELTHDLVEQAGYEVRVLDLRTGEGDHVNLLGEAFAETNFDDFEQTASDIFDKLTDAIRDSDDLYWKQAVKLLATAVACSLPDVGVIPTIPSVAKLVTNSKGLELLQRQVKGKPGENRLNAATTVMRARDTWACVQGCAAATFDYFTTAAGSIAAASGDFSLGGRLASSEGNPLAFYLICPDESKVGDNFASLVFDYAYRSVIKAAEKGLGSRGLQIYIDEAARLPPSCLPQLLSTGRSRNVFVHLYYQQIRQFWESRQGYTQDAALVMIAQMGTIIHLASSDAEEAKRLEVATGCEGVFSTLAQLSVGDALVEARGHPVVRTHVPSFDELRSLGVFGSGS